MTSVAILVGGRATRFGGTDKSALVVGGHSILAHQVEVARSLTDDIMLIGRPEFSTTVPGVRFVCDRVLGSGPLGGLDTALLEASSDAVLLLACDMPFVSAAFLAHLADLAPEADAIVPRTERGYHPLCAVYTRACQEPVRRRLAAHQLRMVDVLSDVRVRVVERGEIDEYGNHEQLLTNVNTPAEFDEVAALPGHKL